MELKIFSLDQLITTIKNKMEIIKYKRREKRKRKFNFRIMISNKLTFWNFE